MKKILALALVFGGWSCLVSPSRVLAQQSHVQAPVTLYAVVKYGDEQHQHCLSLATGIPGVATSKHEPCNLSYGFMSMGNDSDWFRTAVIDGDRSVIKDLGVLDWNSRYQVPVIAALPKLAPGEHRQITIDFTGAGGDTPPVARDSRDLSPASRRANETLPENSSIYASMQPGDDDFVPRPYTPKKKHVERPTTDPKFIVAKASLGHIYVVHVADEVNDFYALFRVDALDKGDHCTISWQMIPAPDPKATRRK